MEMKRLCKVIVLALCCLAAIAAKTPASRMSPLQVSENGRFLVEDAGKPFFILADTAWTLFSGISRQDVQFYLDDRKAKGFNTILCGLLHFDHTAQAQWLPKHRVYGFPAFDGNGYDLSRPNKKYWDHVDWVMEEAQRRSLRLAIAACWFQHNQDGWKGRLTPKNAPRYGEFIGLRSCRYNNIIWLFADDHSPLKVRRELRLLAEGIRYHAPHHLISYQANNASSSGKLSHMERWLAFNSIRTRTRENPGEYALVQQDWHRIPAKPTWLAEPHYEQPGSRFAVRQAAWRSALSGAAGFGYGVNNIFNLEYSSTWKGLLDMPGGADVVNMLGLLQSQPWHKLLPDHAAKDKLLAAVEEHTDLHFSAACSTDGDFGLIYLPVRANLEVNMGKFKSPVMGRWYDPTTNESVVAEGSWFINAGVHALKPPKPNDKTQSDLVLVLTTERPKETVQKTQLDTKAN